MAVVSGLASGGVVLAAVEVATIFLDLAAWIWGERESTMDKLAHELRSAVAWEFGEGWVDQDPSSATEVYDVCWTSHRLGVFADHVEALERAVAKSDGLIYDPPAAAE